ncbi:MAG: hypothetical protein RL215_456 [Planctomycetota bacterium]
MNRKQFVASAFAAAIPAYLLVASMVWALFQGGMLGDEAKVSAALWVVFVLAALGGITIGVLPFAIVIFPGLYPMAATASGSASTASAPTNSTPQEESLEAETTEPLDDEFGGQDEIDSYADEFDEFAEEAVEEEPPQPKKKGRR